MPPPTETCNNCHFAVQTERGDLECHVHAPVALVNQTNHIVTRWPIILPAQWCGDWRPKHP